LAGGGKFEESWGRKNAQGSRDGAQWGSGGPEAEKHVDINAALRITLTFVIGFLRTSHIGAWLSMSQLTRLHN